MSTILTIALKDLRLLRRDRLGFFWVLFFPLVYALFFGSIFGGGEGGRAGRMAIAVVDDDRSDAAGKFAARLEQSESLSVQRLAAPAARDRVRRGQLTAYVVIQKGFGDSPAFFGGSPPALEVGIDPSRRAEAGYLQGILMEAAFAGMREQFMDPGAMRAAVRRSTGQIEADSDLPAGQRAILTGFMFALDTFLGSVDPELYRQGPSVQGPRIEPVAVTQDQKSPRSPFEITFPSSILWGALGCAAAFAISLVSERVGGTFLRLRVAPLSRGAILAGKGLACFMACCGVIVLLLAIGRLFFHVRLENPLGLALAAVCTSLCFVGIMMLLCTLGKTHQSVAGAGWACNVIMAMLGGGTIPLIAMPAWMQKVSHVSPVKWGILSLEGAIWRGFSWTEMLLPCAILVGVGAVCFAIGVTILSRAD